MLLLLQPSEVLDRHRHQVHISEPFFREAFGDDVAFSNMRLLLSMWKDGVRIGEPRSSSYRCRIGPVSLHTVFGLTRDQLDQECRTASTYPGAADILSSRATVLLADVVKVQQEACRKGTCLFVPPLLSSPAQPCPDNFPNLFRQPTAHDVTCVICYKCYLLCMLLCYMLQVVLCPARCTRWRAL